MPSTAFVPTTRPSFYALVHKYSVLVILRVTSLVGSFSNEEFNRPGTFWRIKRNPYRGMTQKLLKNCYLYWSMRHD